MTSFEFNTYPPTLLLQQKLGFSFSTFLWRQLNHFPTRKKLQFIIELGVDFPVMKE